MEVIKYILLCIFLVAQNIMFVLLLARGIMLKKQRKETENCEQVSLCPLLLYVGTLCGGLFSILVTVFGMNGSPSIILIAVFEAFAILGFILMLAYCNETIEYDKETFTVKNLVGFKRTYSYGDITGTRRKGLDTILYCGRRRIRLDYLAKNSRKFKNYANSTYYRLYQKHIPEVTSKDPMRGNLDTPWIYIIFYIWIIIACTLFTLQAVYVIRPAEENLPSTAFEIRTSFVSCKRVSADYGTLVLNAADYEKSFKIHWLSGFDVPVPDSGSLCSGAEFLVSVVEGKTAYRILAISTTDQRVLLSVFDCNNAYRNTQLVAVYISLVFNVIATISAIFGILVGRNPKKFPKWFRNLFYKSWAWTSSNSQNGKKRRKRRR